MNLLVSNQDRGSLRVVKISKKSNDMLHVDIKGELCHLSNASGVNNYIAKILTFQFQNIAHLVILRKNGSIQLYTKNPNLPYYNLFKDWKNNLTNITGDGIIALDILDNQYLYSCSREGKLIIRDLINDDADESYKVYMVGNSIGKVDLRLDRYKNTIAVAICGKNCDLKLYEIDLNMDVEGQRPERNQAELSYVGLLRNHPLQRSFTTLNLNPRQQRPPASYRNLDRSSVLSLCHYWKSTTDMDQYTYNPNNLERISQWMSSVCFIEESDYIICGSQMGELVIYNPVEDTAPIFSARVSQFSIKTIKQMDDDYVILSDSVSKIAIFQISTREIVLEYQGLEFGPFLFLEYILPSMPKRKVSGSKLSFEEIYVMATTVDKRVVVYKLLDNGSYELLLDVKLFDSLIPSISMLHSVSEHYQFRAVFEVDMKHDPNIYKKRKVSPNLAIPISNQSGIKREYEHILPGVPDSVEASYLSFASSSESENDQGEFVDDTTLQKMLVK
jgi:hypothetical protein